MLANDALRRRLKVPRPRVVPEPLPQPQDLLLAAPRQIENRRKSGDEAVVIRNHRRDLRLLQHRLADEHVVRLRHSAGSTIHPPRQIAPMPPIPGDAAFVRIAIANPASLGFYLCRSHRA